MKHTLIRRSLSIILIISLIFNMIGCEAISSKHIEATYEENDNPNLTYWDDVDDGDYSYWENNQNITTWDDIDEYSDYVYSEIIFDDITSEYPLIDSEVLDYSNSAEYFDGERVRKLVGDKFDINSFVSKYAVGTGVIVICIILNVATSGISSPIACFVAGAADSAVSSAIKGAAFGAATKAVAEAIKSEGDIEDTLYGALEGSSDGYMWGAVYGAITGGFSSKYCFVSDTAVKTEYGYKPICELSVGDLVYSYNEKTDSFTYEPITQVIINETTSLIAISINGETIRSTPTHPYFTDSGWKKAADLTIHDRLFSSAHKYVAIDSISQLTLNIPLTTYSLCIDKAHTFIVGENGLVVHNQCINQKYAGQTYKIDAEKKPDLAKKYPDGVPFSKNGYPDFSNYAKETITMEKYSSRNAALGKCLTGQRAHDNSLANKMAGYSSTPEGYTWHHLEDCRTVQLIPTDLHSEVRHTGGASILNSLQ